MTFLVNLEIAILKCDQPTLVQGVKCYSGTRHNLNTFFNTCAFDIHDPYFHLQ